ncbi:MAG: aminotransferase class III-fold pyridoxal phosphate-dependent enzyme, partial [Burkholderiaceae bacterium]|nr:aminotransferase class III-fold pyridoxal phosphate-dependent enzyme [Burkholderiaceae bacterium]
MKSEVLPGLQLSLDEWWMPFTANRHYKAAPRLLARAEGMYYYTPEGRQILDGTSGLWCVNAGHCRQPIVEAVKRQAETMDYASPFNMGHPLAFEAARVIADLAPPGMRRVFFVNSGSEAVDTALKTALAYWRARGEPTRRIVIGRERGYHGVNLGGTAVGGVPANRKAYGAL